MGDETAVLIGSGLRFFECYERNIDRSGLAFSTTHKPPKVAEPITVVLLPDKLELELSGTVIYCMSPQNSREPNSRLVDWCQIRTHT